MRCRASFKMEMKLKFAANCLNPSWKRFRRRTILFVTTLNFSHTISLFSTLSVFLDFIYVFCLYIPQPPKELYIVVRVLVPSGDIMTDNGPVNLSSVGDTLFLRRYSIYYDSSQKYQPRPRNARTVYANVKSIASLLFSSPDSSIE